MREAIQSSEPGIWVFHVSSRYRQLRLMVVSCGSSLLAGFGLFLLLHRIYIGVINPAAIVFSIMCIIIAIVWYWRFQSWIANTSLTLSPTTLDYQTPGLRIQTDWSNVDAVVEGLDPRWGHIPLPHLRLHNRASVHMSGLMLFERWASSYGWNIDRRIPLDIFSWERSSELRLVLQRLAPQHFPAYITKSAAHTRRR